VNALLRLFVSRRSTDRGREEIVQQIVGRITYANAMSTIAVVISLGGATAFAATHLAKNSVGTRQLRKGAVTAAKLKVGAVNGTKVADGSLTGQDVNAATLGTVPSAVNAAHAASADLASSLGTLPSGKSESGAFAISGAAFALVSEGITFPQPLAGRVPAGNVEIVGRLGSFTSGCPGPGAAAPNHLCLYESQEAEIESLEVVDPASDFGSGREGFIVKGRSLGSLGRFFGSWTVTAP
jgi:hypothetical protein